MHVTYCREIDFNSFVGNVLSCQVSDEESQDVFRGWQCTCIDSLAEFPEPLLVSAVSASGVSCEAIVEVVLSFELEVFLKFELVGDS